MKGTTEVPQEYDHICYSFLLIHCLASLSLYLEFVECRGVGAGLLLRVTSNSSYNKKPSPHSNSSREGLSQISSQRNWLAPSVDSMKVGSGGLVSSPSLPLVGAWCGKEMFACCYFIVNDEELLSVFKGSMKALSLYKEIV